MIKLIWLYSFCIALTFCPAEGLEYDKYCDDVGVEQYNTAFSQLDYYAEIISNYIIVIDGPIKLNNPFNANVKFVINFSKKQKYSIFVYDEIYLRIFQTQNEPFEDDAVQIKAISTENDCILTYTNLFIYNIKENNTNYLLYLMIFIIIFLIFIVTREFIAMYHIIWKKPLTIKEKIDYV